VIVTNAAILLTLKIHINYKNAPKILFYFVEDYDFLVPEFGKK